MKKKNLLAFLRAAAAGGAPNPCWMLDFFSEKKEIEWSREVFQEIFVGIDQTDESQPHQPLPVEVGSGGLVFYSNLGTRVSLSWDGSLSVSSGEGLPLQTPYYRCLAIEMDQIENSSILGLWVNTLDPEMTGRYIHESEGTFWAWLKFQAGMREESLFPQVEKFEELFTLDPPEEALSLPFINGERDDRRVSPTSTTVELLYSNEWKKISTKRLLDGKLLVWGERPIFMPWDIIAVVADSGKM